jgi:hypothetical protein
MMADYGLFIGWGTPARGREQKTLQVFSEAMEYYQRLQQEGTIESFHTVLLEPHGGDLNGFALLMGNRDKLAALRWQDDFQRLNARALLVVEGFGVVGATIDGGLAQLMGTYQQQLGELA